MNVGYGGFDELLGQSMNSAFTSHLTLVYLKERETEMNLCITIAFSHRLSPGRNGLVVSNT